MQIAIGSLILNADFLVAYGCGLVILILFCMERFNQPTAADGSFIETLVPRAVSNGYRYIQSFVIYVAIMVVVYTGLSIVGPHVFAAFGRSEEHTSELQSLMRISYAVFCLKKKIKHIQSELTESMPHRLTSNHYSLSHTPNHTL